MPPKGRAQAAAKRRADDAADADAKRKRKELRDPRGGGGGGGVGAQAAASSSSVTLEVAVLEPLKAAIRALSIGNTLETLIGREKEVADIVAFLRARDAEPTLQLFGMPGTGKTAAVRCAIAAVRKTNPSISVCFLNGYVMQRPTEVYTMLWQRLSADRLAHEERLTPEQAQGQLERRFKSGWGSSSTAALPLCVIVVDEVDRCCERSGKTLFRLVDWMTLPHANCKLLTIANKFNLPEQMDAKTRSRLNTTQRVTFHSYTAQQLQDIVESRFAAIRTSAAAPYKIIAPSALTYLCNLVAGQFGDTRRLLQAASSALHARLIELSESSGGGTGTAAAAKEDFTEGIVAIKDLRSIVRSIFHDPFGDFIQAIDAPFLFLACGVIAFETRKAEAALSSPRIDAVYMHTQMVRTIEQFRGLFPAMASQAGRDARSIVSLSDWYHLLRPLWDTKLITMSTGDDDNAETLTSVHECLACAAPVFATLEQPFEMLITNLETHPTWGNIAVKMFRSTA